MVDDILPLPRAAQNYCHNPKRNDQGTAEQDPNLQTLRPTIVTGLRISCCKCKILFNTITRRIIAAINSSMINKGL